MFTYPETIQDAKCHRCDLTFNDLVFTWYDDEGCSECPECGNNIWLDDSQRIDPSEDSAEINRLRWL